MSKEDIESSSKWLNDPGPVSEADLEEARRANFRSYKRRGLKPSDLREPEAHEYDAWLRRAE